MKKTIIFCMAAFLCLLISGVILAKDSKKNKIRHNNPIVESLWCRQSPMAFTAADEFKKGEDPDLARLLCWAAVGVNGIKLKADGTPSLNPDGTPKTKLTIPTAMNTQLITVYAVNKDGVYQYDPANDELVLVPGMEEDYRDDAALQPPYQTNPLILIFVADLSKFPSGNKPGGFYSTRDELVYAAAISVGAAAENVYLYMASTKGRLGAHYYTAMKKQLWHEYLGLPDLCEDTDGSGNCEYNVTATETYIEPYLAPNKLVMGAMTIGYPGYPITCPCPSE